MPRDVRRRRAKDILRRAMDLDLPHMGVPAVLMIADDRYLNHECPNGPIVDVLNRDHYPSARLVQIHHLHFLQIVEIGPSSDAYPKNQPERLR